MKRATLWITLAVVLALVGTPLTAQTGGLRYTVTVTQFENQAGWAGLWDIGNGWGTVLTDLLTQSGKFIVLGETDMRNEALAEQDFAASGRTAQGSKAPQIGQMTPAQLLVKGTITHVQHNVKGGGGGIAYRGIRLGGKAGKSEINITIYMVDSTTGQVVASKSVVGTAKQKGARVGYSNAGWSTAFGGNKDDNLGKAVADAADQAVEWLIDQLPGFTWRGSVIQVKDGQVYVNRGTREGVASGQSFIIGELEVLRDPGTGEVLDESVTEIARLQCGTVKEKLSICAVTSGSAAAVKKGMGVMPAG